MCGGIGLLNLKGSCDMVTVFVTYDGPRLVLGGSFNLELVICQYILR